MMTSTWTALGAGPGRMKVADLFSGMGGWSAPFLAAGDDVFRVEIDPAFPAELHADMRDVTAADFPWRPDLILASPPCEGFSVMNIGRNWHHDGTPKTDTARLALDLVRTTLRLVRDLEPTFWIMENPRAKLRVLPVVAGLERRSVVYCAYGEDRMKPTDLWSDRWPPSLVLAPVCANGDPCHVRAPRGSRTGTQGPRSYHQKSVVPFALGAAVRAAVLVDLDAGRGGAGHADVPLALWPELEGAR
jgi:hypothetical protein